MIPSLSLRLLLLLPVSAPKPTIPAVLIGDWKVVHAYDTPGPTDLNQQQDAEIMKLRFEVTSDSIKLCGHNLSIKTADLSLMTPDQFATRYRMLPNRIGLRSSTITEIQINSFELTHACGEFSDPGTDIIFDDQNHFAIQVDNAYYQIRRAR
jgi:hypothetical protein